MFLAIKSLIRRGFSFILSPRLIFIEDYYHSSEDPLLFRSNHRRCSGKKVFLQILQNSQESTCPKVSFLIKLQVLGLQLHLKRDSGTGVFLWILRNFKERLSLQNTTSGCFWAIHVTVIIFTILSFHNLVVKRMFTLK